MSNRNNPRRGDDKRTENGPRWEGPETDRNSARGRRNWKRIIARKERRTGQLLPDCGPMYRPRVRPDLDVALGDGSSDLGESP